MWEVANPDPRNGHATMGCGYNSQGVKTGSWGLLGIETWAALEALCQPSAGGGLWTLLTPDQICKATGKAPNGLAWEDLLSDLKALQSA